MIEHIHYIYIYLDPRKPGNFQYGDLKFEFEPFYVGLGKKKRYKDHISNRDLNKNNYKSKKLKKIISVGFDPLEFIIFYKEKISLKEAEKIEKNLISQIGRTCLGSGPLTNIADGGLAGTSTAKKGKSWEEIYGKEKADHLKREMSKKMKGRRGKSTKANGYVKVVSEETKIKIRQAKARPVLQINPTDLSIIAEFPSPRDAAEKLGISRSGINNMMSPNYRTKTAGGFLWVYKKDYEEMGKRAILIKGRLTKRDRELKLKPELRDPLKITDINLMAEASGFGQYNPALLSSQSND